MELPEAVTGLSAATIAVLAIYIVAKTMQSLAKNLYERSTTAPSMAEAIKALADSISVMTKNTNQAVVEMAEGFNLLRRAVEQHEQEEERREQQQIERHERMLETIALLVTMIKDTPGDVKTAIIKIGELGEKMDEHIDQSPGVLEELRAIRTLIEGVNTRLDNLDGKMDTFASTTKGEVADLRQDVQIIQEKTAQIEQKITAENPTIEQPTITENQTEEHKDG